jgi:hypothetical protein
VSILITQPLLPGKELKKMRKMNTKEIDKAIKRARLKHAFYRSVGIVTSMLGAVTLLIALTSDKSWETIAIGIALIAIGLSEESMSGNIISDLMLNVINQKLDLLGTESHAIHSLLSVEEKLNNLLENINNAKVRIRKTKKHASI